MERLFMEEIAKQSQVQHVTCELVALPIDMVVTVTAVTTASAVKAARRGNQAPRHI